MAAGENGVRQSSGTSLELSKQADAGIAEPAGSDPRTRLAYQDWPTWSYYLPGFRVLAH
jgi:hypothetical protein